MQVLGSMAYSTCNLRHMLTSDPEALTVVLKQLLWFVRQKAIIDWL